MLPPGFRRCLELAWEAYCAGSFPIGALVCDADGVVVAEGRNRIGETDAPPGRLRHTALAHAEMDVLAQLPIGEYADHVLYSSLEPCLLCRAAITMTHIGTVHHLAADVICDGLDGIRGLTAHTVRRYPTMHGPYPGLEADVASILPMAVRDGPQPDGLGGRAVPDAHAAPRRRRGSHPASTTCGRRATGPSTRRSPTSCPCCTPDPRVWSLPRHLHAPATKRTSWPPRLCTNASM